MRLLVTASVFAEDEMIEEPSDGTAATVMAASLGQRTDSKVFDNGQYEQIQMQQQQQQHQQHHHRHHHHHHLSRPFKDELRPHHAIRKSSRSTLTSLESGDMLAGGNEGSVTATTTCLSTNRKASGSASGSSGLSRHRIRRRWPEVAILGRALFITSVVFFVVGILVTVFGFGGGEPEYREVEAATETDVIGLLVTSPEAGVRPSRQALPLQIIGPALLVATLVVWLAGLVFWRIWSTESKRRQRAIELRTRVQLHSIAMDLLKHSLGSRLDCSDLLQETHAGIHRFSDSVSARLSPRLVAELQDPRLRRLLLRELRQERALDLVSSPENSRRSSLAASFQSRRRRCSSSTVSAMLRHGAASTSPRGQHRLSVDVTSGKSSRASHRGRFPCKLPGIEISRIDTMDFDNESSRFSSFTEGLRLGSLVTGHGGRQRFIVIHSDGSSEISRLSFPSEYSLSATSRSRSSRASSNVSSRLWDFSSPRESDWDFAENASASNAGVGSSSAATMTSRPDLRSVRDYSLLSPAMPRKGSSVTFDIGEPTVRRHSSPAPSLRFRKDSVAEADRYGNNIQSSYATGEIESLTTAKKSTAASSCIGAATERGVPGNGNTTSPSQRVHQPLEKRSSSSRGGRSAVDQKRDSPLSVVMTTAVHHEDSRTGSRVDRTVTGNVDPASRKQRSSLSSLKTTISGEASRTAKAKIEVLYGSSGCGVFKTSPTSNTYTSLRRSTAADVRCNPQHNNNDGSGNGGVQTTVDALVRPRSASLRAEAETQTPPPANVTGRFKQHRHVVNSFSSNILSPLRSSCFAELSASDNEENNSD